ncbi:MAG: flavin monoamine oxidase family protein [Nodosilinea sp.]
MMGVDRRRFIQGGQGLLVGLALGQACRPPQGEASDRSRVLVIGAGLAGLAAAQSLAQENYPVVVLEARDRLGGRTWTTTHWPDLPVDMGASWIHGLRGNPLTALARAAAVDLVTTDYNNALIYGPSGQPLGPDQEIYLARLGDRITTALATAQGRDPDQSVQAAVRAALDWSALSLADQQQVIFLLNSTLEQEYGGSVGQLSAHWYDDGEPFAGPDALLPAGYQAIVASLARGLDIRLNQAVQAVDWSGGAVVVTTNQATYRADRVVVSLSLGVLKSGAVAFSPPLPEAKTTAITYLGMGVLNKCYLRFPRVFWPDTVDWLEQISSPPGLWTELWTEWVSLVPSLRQPVLLGFNAADQGQAMESWSDGTIVDSALATLQRLFGRLPEPLDYQISRWYRDRYALGAYSFNALGSTPAMGDHLGQGLAGRLFLAGEATARAIGEPPDSGRESYPCLG